METQIPMTFARARNSDPVTSHVAARRVERSGKAGQQRIVAGAALLRWPGRTARELASLIGGSEIKVLENYRMLGRRLPELRESGEAQNGDPRQCAILGTQALTWWPL